MNSKDFARSKKEDPPSIEEVPANVEVAISIINMIGNDIEDKREEVDRLANQTKGFLKGMQEAKRIISESDAHGMMTRKIEQMSEESRRLSIEYTGMTCAYDEVINYLDKRRKVLSSETFEKETDAKK